MLAALYGSPGTVGSYRGRMTADSAPDAPVIIGYDGSRPAAGAIQLGARLFPGRHGRIAHLWGPPYFDGELRKRMWPPSADLDEFAEAIEREGHAEAERTATEGKVLAEAAGWSASVLLHRCYGDPGFELAQLAEREQAAAVVVGSRGLGGVRAMLGSSSDGLVHYSPVPVLVVPYPLLESERDAAGAGPLLVASDGSDGAAHALGAARSLFPDRDVEVAAVGIEESEAEIVQLQPRGVTSSGRAVAEALADHARQIDAAAIVVGSRGRAAHRELLLGSVAMATLHHAHRPVLVVPRKGGQPPQA